MILTKDVFRQKGFFVMLVMVIVACFETSVDEKRDWVHWLGVLVYCLLLGSTVLGFVFSGLLTP